MPPQDPDVGEALEDVLVVVPVEDVLVEDLLVVVEDLLVVVEVRVDDVVGDEDPFPEQALTVRLFSQERCVERRVHVLGLQSPLASALGVFCDHHLA